MQHSLLQNQPSQMLDAALQTQKNTHTCTSVAILAQAFWLKPFCLKRVSFDYELLTQCILLLSSRNQQLAPGVPT